MPYNSLYVKLCFAYDLQHETMPVTGVRRQWQTLCAPYITSPHGQLFLDQIPPKRYTNSPERLGFMASKEKKSKARDEKGEVV